MRSVVIVLVLLAVPLLPAQEPQRLTEDQKIVHVLSRVTFGPLPGQVAAVKDMGLKKWIDRQLDPRSIKDSKIEELLERYPALRMTPKEMAEWSETKKKPDAARKSVKDQLRTSIVLRARYSERQLVEVLADFWRNHFNVDVDKGSVAETAAHYEYGVLRPYILGSFYKMLLGTARHPAMLVYLDNYLSRRRPTKAELNLVKNRVRRQTGSKEKAEQRVAIAEQSGLNENYARELMELHTLGVDNGYTQKDVVEVSRAFTGWTVDRKSGDTWFKYREDMHEKGAKHLMGRDLPRGRRKSGVIEGEAIIKRLAYHQNTAEFIALKLCRRLVSDYPSEKLVNDIAAVYRRSKGDLGKVTKAILNHPEFFNPANFQAKFKTPFEYVISVIRTTGAEVRSAQPVLAIVKELGQELYSCEDPTGYSDATSDWRDPGVMALRWRFAMRLSRGEIKGLRIPDKFYAGLPQDLLELPQALVARVVPQGIGPETTRVLQRVLFREVQKAGSLERLNRKKLLQLFVGILLGSPEFQQQ